MKFEKIRIPYYDSVFDKNRIYITDFVDEQNKIIYEVKPEELFYPDSDKIETAINWCKNNGYKFKHIDIRKLVELYDKVNFNLLDADTTRKFNHAIDKEKRNNQTRCNVQSSCKNKS